MHGRTWGKYNTFDFSLTYRFVGIQGADQIALMCTYGIWTEATAVEWTTTWLPVTTWVASEEIGYDTLEKLELRVFLWQVA